ncbi:hypothetical protein C8F04DRAFT_1401060 [Mycena alexandri]|uniref:DUF6532 domain-containing protein n=1 Tax=Mycena alexandri TaxID=1745969 RepID=A0AAD6WUZ5_9AGAR|nr:hypothetical protein C8F04DRAFT_1401060 [Mycena alexandri]
MSPAGSQASSRQPQPPKKVASSRGSQTQKKQPKLSDDGQTTRKRKDPPPIDENGGRPPKTRKGDPIPESTTGKRKDPPHSDENGGRPSKTRKGDPVVPSTSKAPETTTTVLVRPDRPKREVKATVDRYNRESAAIQLNPRPTNKPSLPEDTPDNEFAPPPASGRKALHPYNNRPAEQEAPLMVKAVVPRGTAVRKDRPKPKPLYKAAATSAPSSRRPRNRIYSDDDMEEEEPTLLRKKKQHFGINKVEDAANLFHDDAGIIGNVEDVQQDNNQSHNHGQQEDQDENEDEEDELNDNDNDDDDNDNEYQQEDDNEDDLGYKDENASDHDNHRSDYDHNDHPNDNQHDRTNEDDEEDDNNAWTQARYAPAPPRGRPQDQTRDSVSPPTQHSRRPSPLPEHHRPAGRPRDQTRDSVSPPTKHSRRPSPPPEHHRPAGRPQDQTRDSVSPPTQHSRRSSPPPEHHRPAGRSQDQTRDSDDEADPELASRYAPRNHGHIRDVVASHRHKNKTNRLPDAAKLDHHRRLQQEDVQEEEKEEEDQPAGRKRRRRRQSEPTPRQEAFYPPLWKQVIKLAQMKIQEHLLSTEFFPEKEEVLREAPHLLAQSVAEIEDFNKTELSPAFYKKHRDDIYEMMWAEVAHYRGAAKNDCRSVADQFYNIVPAPDKYEGQQKIADKVSGLLEKSRFLQRRNQDGTIDNMMAPALGKVIELLLFGAPNKRTERVGDVYAGEFLRYTPRLVAAGAVVLRCCMDEYRTGRQKTVQLTSTAYASFYNTVFMKLEQTKTDAELWDKMTGEWMKWRDGSHKARGFEWRKKGQFVSSDVFDFE